MNIGAVYFEKVHLFVFFLFLFFYRYFKYKLKYLNSYVPGLYNGAECPLCPKVGTLYTCTEVAPFGH